jgi:hypothetical protein
MVGKSREQAKLRFLRGVGQKAPGPEGLANGSLSKESRLAATAARYKVDVEKISPQVKAELSNKKSKKPANSGAKSRQACSAGSLI